VTTKPFLFIGDHAETLQSGRRVAPGEDLAASAVDPKSDVDRRLIDDGVLIEPRAAKKAAAGEPEEDAR